MEHRYLASVEVTNRSELMVRFEQIKFILELVNKQESHFKHIRNNQIRWCEVHVSRKCGVEEISHFNTPNASVIISII